MKLGAKGARVLFCLYAILCALALCCSDFCLARDATARTKPYRIYIDADWSNSWASSRAIEQGLRTALSLEGDTLDGIAAQVAPHDHRANTRRHQANLQAFKDDPDGLALVAGLHSPPLLANQGYINQNCLLTLVAWAAAGPITRHPEPNCIFRLSVDDAVAGRRIVEHAVTVRGFRKMAVLAEDTAWGRFNIENMTRAVLERGCPPPAAYVFNWGLSIAQARILLRKAAADGVQAVLLVANPAESVIFVRAMADIEPEFKRPFQSHWGCSAGSFVEQVGLQTLQKVDLEFIQSRFSFLHLDLPPLAQKALQRAKKLFPQEIASAEDITPPNAFTHAFDLGLLLAAAARQAGLSGQVLQDRENLKQALENLETPVQGLIKTYVSPFSPWSEDDPQAHEALDGDDYVMARFDAAGRIVLEQP